MTDRACGGCSLCCKLLPVASLGKPDNTRCRYQRHSVGCTVHAHLATVAPDCLVWNCRWLGDPATAGLSRPDRSHLVIDIMPDFITVRPDDGSPPTDVPVIQVWCDPAFPDAHREPGFRAYLDREARVNGMAAIIRFSAREALVLVAPSLASDGQWHEMTSGLVVVPNSIERMEKSWGAGMTINLAP
jgi:hypothetical protein